MTFSNQAANHLFMGPSLGPAQPCIPSSKGSKAAAASSRHLISVWYRRLTMHGERKGKLVPFHDASSCYDQVHTASVKNK